MKISKKIRTVPWGWSGYEPTFKYEYERTVSRSDCMHQSCTQCHGSGRKGDGTSCIHMISCPCKICSPGTL